jgi:hypothetical protein
MELWETFKTQTTFCLSSSNAHVNLTLKNAFKSKRYYSLSYSSIAKKSKFKVFSDTQVKLLSGNPCKIQKQVTHSQHYNVVAIKFFILKGRTGGLERRECTKARPKSSRENTRY